MIKKLQMNCIGSHSGPVGLGDEDPLHWKFHEITLEIRIQTHTAVGADLACDLYALGLSERGAQGMGHQMKRGFVHRTALD